MNEMNDSLFIGILGGMGTYATVHIFEQYAEIFPAVKEWERPRIIIDNRCTMPSRVRAFLYNENCNRLVNEMRESLVNFSKMGCNKIIMGCNTAHLFLDEIIEGTPELENKVVNIIDVCVNEVKRKSITEVYLIATEGTIDSGIYHERLKQIGVKCISPENGEYDKIRQCIEAVKQNNYSDSIKKIFEDLVNRSNACILGCTELPILLKKYKDSISCKNIFDPIELALLEIKQGV